MWWWSGGILEEGGSDARARHSGPLDSVFSIRSVALSKKKRCGAAAAQQIQHSLGGTKGDVDHTYLEWCGGVVLASRDENGMDIF
jgi:hypothetical protein